VVKPRRLRAYEVLTGNTAGQQGVRMYFLSQDRSGNTGKGDGGSEWMDSEWATEAVLPEIAQQALRRCKYWWERRRGG